MQVAIVGSSPSSEMLAPFNDQSWEIWVLAQRVAEYSRISRIFEVHDKRNQDYYKKLVALGIPLIVGEGFSVAADHVTVFPFEKAKALLGSDYLTSSIAYMMALAILEGATHIGIYGVDMSVSDSEYLYQQPCMTAWVGFAKGKGIEVTIPEESSLFKSKYIYGQSYKTDCALPPFTSEGFLALEKQHQSRIDGLREEIKAKEQAIFAHDGARQAYERMAKVARSIEAGQVIQSLSHTAILR